MFKRGNRIYLGLDTFASAAPSVCASPHRTAIASASSFKLRRDAKDRHLYRSHVKWSDHFAHGQKGLYQAVWHYGKTKLPGITFTVG